MPNRNWSGLRGRITRRKSDLNDDDVYDENTLGCWKLKNHASAERTLQWVKKKNRKGRRGKFPIFEGAVREVEADHLPMRWVPKSYSQSSIRHSMRRTAGQTFAFHSADDS